MNPKNKALVKVCHQSEFNNRILEFQFIPMRLFSLFIQPVEYIANLAQLVASNNNFKNLLNFSGGKKSSTLPKKKEKMILFLTV